MSPAGYSFSLRSSFLNLFWLNGIWNWTAEYFPYINIYSNLILQIFVFVPVILAFAALLFKGKYRKINLCFAIGIIVLMFLSKGLHAPFESVNLFLYNHIPGAYVFREPFLKLYLLLVTPLALLIGFSTNAMTEKIKFTHIPRKKLVALLFVVIIASSFIISVFPIFNSQTLFSKTASFPFSSYVKIPDYWYQASDYINNIPGNFRVLQTPGDDFYQVPYLWGYYGSDAIASSLITKPVIQNNGGYSSVQDMTSLIFREIDENNSIAFSNLLALLNVKYIIQRNDVWWNYTGRQIDSPQYMKAFLSSQPNLKLQVSFGQLDLYEVVDNQSHPQIYPTHDSAFINSSSITFSQIISSENTNINNPAFFMSDQLSSQQEQFIANMSSNAFVNTFEASAQPQNGLMVPFNWANASNGINIRYYYGWKTIVRTDGNETGDSLSFPSLDSCPYQFSSAYNGTHWSALDSTIVYVKTGNTPLTISRVLETGQPITDILGVWWQTGWEGMGTKLLQYPIVIPPNQDAIIQINHIVTSNLTFVNSETISYNNSSNSQSDENLPQLTFNEVNPTKYTIQVTNATKPFFLVFSESYDPQWKAYVSSNNIVLGNVIVSYGNVQEATSGNAFTVQDISYLFSQPLSDQYHFITNGYANAWYIDPQQLHQGTDFTITLFFVPQAYYYVGVVITAIAIITCTCYLLFTLVITKKLYRKLSN